MSSMIIAVFLVLLTYLLIRYRYFKRKSKQHSLTVDDITGPRGLPFFGNVWDLLYNEVQLWDIMRKRALKYYPIYKLKNFSQNVVIILDPRDIEMILMDDTCVKGQMYDTAREFTGNGLIVSDGDLWRQRRKAITKSFHFSFLSTYITVFDKQMDNFIEKLQDQMNAPIDLLSNMATLTLRVIREAIVGERLPLKESEIVNYIKSINTITEAIMYKSALPYLKCIYGLSALKRKEVEAVNYVKNFSNKVYEESIKLPIVHDENGLRLINILMNNRNLFQTTEDITNELNTFIFAGQDTTASALSFTLMVLANHPKFQKEIRDEMIEVGVENGLATYSQLKNMHVLDRFFKECLRLFPPAIFIARTLTRDIITKTGYMLPAGTITVMPIIDIHRSPNLFPNPDKFDPDRFLPDNIEKRHPFAYIPFSGGHRNCVAQKFATLEVKTMICKILNKFTLEQITEMDKLVFRLDLVIKTEENIEIKFVPR